MQTREQLVLLIVCAEQCARCRRRGAQELPGAGVRRAARALLRALCAMADPAGRVDGSAVEIAARAQVSRATYYRVTRELELAGAVRRDRREARHVAA